jgi:acetyl esterase/lipase/SAM-dependent methyltransferase
MSAPRVLREVIYATPPGFRPLALDLYLPDAPHPPVVLFAHGGGWRAGSRAVFVPHVSVADSFERIVAAGFAVASVDYRLSGEALYPAQVDDVRAALAWVRSSGERYGFDGSRVVLWGESAGATLVALVGLEPGSGVLGVVDWYGPADLLAMARGLSSEETALTRETGWLGASARSTTPSARRAASPLYAVQAGAPPFHIEHGDSPMSRCRNRAEPWHSPTALLARGCRPVDLVAVADAGQHIWGGVADTAPIVDAGDSTSRLARGLRFRRPVPVIVDPGRRRSPTPRSCNGDCGTPTPRAGSSTASRTTAPLFEAVLDAARVARQASSLLDVGCGTGLAARAGPVARGATCRPAIDVAPGLLGVAVAAGCRTADLRLGDLHRFCRSQDGSFDSVTAVNSFQFAADPLAAIAEAARLLTRGGILAIGMFAEPERAQSTAIHVAMSRLSPPAREADHAPYALSAPGNLEAALDAAGLIVSGTGEVECEWSYANVDHALRGLMGSAGGTRAIEDAGRDAVATAIRTALEPFTDLGTGAVLMRNTFRWISGEKS